MGIPAAYMTVILIWSTTPLAIKWSSVGVGYEFGVAARMVIGLGALLLVVYIRRLPMSLDKHALRVYMASGLPLFVTMNLVYWSAQHIPSGWISVIFGLSPLFTSVFASFILRENAFSGGRLLGMLLGLAGLAIVFSESLSVSTMALLGVAGVTVGVLSQSLGAVVIRALRPSMPSISITTGGLMLATPLFVLNSLLFGGLPDQVPLNTMMSITYLAILGTATGFPLYFYLLKQINAERVALITLITPITALLIGAYLNGEIISLRVWAGALLVIIGLAIYEYGKYLPFSKKWQLRWNQRPL